MAFSDEQDIMTVAALVLDDTSRQAFVSDPAHG
jgi:hypothetical protein